MKLVQLNAGRSTTMDRSWRVPLFNPSELLWRSPSGWIGFPPTSHSAVHQLDYFKTHLPASLASDPRLWTREDVISFLRWCEYEFDLPRFDMDVFQMNGKALCVLTKADLNERSPGCGDVLHNVLHMLMRARLPTSPVTPHLPLTPSWNIQPALELTTNPVPTSQPPTAVSSVTLSPAPSLDSQGSPRQLDLHQTGQSAPHPSQVVNYQSGHSGSSGSMPSDSDCEEPTSPHVGPHLAAQPLASPHLTSPQPQSPIGHNSHANKPQIFFPESKQQMFFPETIAEPNTNGRLLWDFLQQLLNDSLQRYTSYIAWKNREAGVFKIVDPPGLAKLWGIQKNHLSMNYDKMSRALRYYYRVNILRKVQGERHCYQFLRNPSELKSIKHISLLRNHISQNQGQPTQQTMPPSPQQQQQQQMTTINTQQQQQLVNSDEPTDLRTHTHQPIDCGEQPQQSPSTTYETVTEMRRLAQQQQKQQQSIITTAQTSSANSTSPANLYHPPPPASHQAEDLSISPASSITIKSEIS
ncbi:ETS variant transcription factor anterior open isoform X2 [Rhodnius prolixus]|uniref:ETS variant transcription factor anterior open isoform X2 n=1 Tax=Rhodnius prolixus TaxID=13249 RepID=UPI003D18CCA3